MLAWCSIALLGISLLACPAAAAAFQFEVLGASDDWIAIRENIPAAASDTAACSYPRLDPSEQVGVTVHFVRISPEAKRGRLTSFDTSSASMPLYSRGRAGESCTSAAEAERRLREIVQRAKSLGISVANANPKPSTLLGEAVPAKACVLIGAGGGSGSPCRRVFNQRLKDRTAQIGLSLVAVPEAPDNRSCQFVGYRFEAAIQVSGGDLGTMESGIVPGGLANHYDCRNQQFDPLRLYVFDNYVVLLGSFRGTNIADREEHPFLILFPARPGA